jgi:hypothetical protein
VCVCLCVCVCVCVNSACNDPHFPVSVSRPFTVEAALSLRRDGQCPMSNVKQWPSSHPSSQLSSLSRAGTWVYVRGLSCRRHTVWMVTVAEPRCGSEPHLSNDSTSRGRVASCCYQGHGITVWVVVNACLNLAFVCSCKQIRYCVGTSEHRKGESEHCACAHVRSRLSPPPPMV